MRKQQPGLSPHSRHHPSSREMQLFQQHLMYKQLQEIQRQQQIHQLDQGARQQSLLSQASFKQQAAFNQLPPLLNGMPINNSSSYILPNAMGGESMTLNNSQMFIADDTNWAPQQVNQSLYGTPVSNSRDLMNQYPQFQGMPNNFNDKMAKAIGTHLEKPTLLPVPSNSFHKDQCIPELKSLQDNISVSGLGLVSGSSQNLNGDSISSNFHGVTSLDPTEEKFLFGTDDDRNWDASVGNSSSMGTGGYLHGNPSESNDPFGSFPSLQSGSWSALMQEAVQASTSDNGVQEEWSGLSFQKIEQSFGNSSAIHNDNNNFQSVQTAPSLSSRPFPLANDANSGPPCPTDPNFLLSSGTVYKENGRIQTDARALYGLDGQNTLSGMELGRSDNGSSEIIPLLSSSMSNFANVVNSNNLIASHGMNQHALNNGNQVDSTVNSKEPTPSISNSQTLSGLPNWKAVGSQRFQSHPMEILGMNMKKGHSADSQRRINSPEETQYGSTVPPQTSTQNETHEAATTRLSSSHLQHHQSSIFKGFGIHLASPSQRQPSLDFNRRQIDSEEGDKDQMQSASASSDQSLHQAPETSQRKNLDGNSNLSGQKSNTISQSIFQGNSSTITDSDLSYMRHQLQLQKQPQLHQSANLSFGTQADVDQHIKHASLLKQAQISCDIAVSGQSTQTSFPTMAGRILPFRLDSSDTHRPILQSSVMSGISQQVGFSTMLRNTWTNASLQQGTSGGGPHKLFHNVPQSIILPTNSKGENFGAVQMEDDQDKNPVEESFFQGTHSERGDVNPKTGSASDEQEQLRKHLLDSNKGEHRPSIASSDIPLKVQQTNYSLLQQMQARNGSDSDATRDGKRLRVDPGSGVSHRGYFYNENTVLRQPVDGELAATSHNSFQSDVKMLKFPLKENEWRSIQKTQPLITPPNFMGRGEHSPISPHIARSWFEQYRKYKNGQIFAMHADQNSEKHSAEVSERFNTNNILEQRIDVLSQSVSPSTRPSNELSPVPLDVSGHNMVMKSRKRKTATSKLLPWHRVVSLGVQRLQSISSAECDWAQAANRLTEKVEDEAEIIEDGLSKPQARRRIILTTQLMQKLLPAVPATVLAAEVTSAYESMTYLLAKSALGDACNLISCSGSDLSAYLDEGNRLSEECKTPQKTSDIFFSKVVENFIGRLRKLEYDLPRLEKRTSGLDVRLECQELERFSLVNRLGNFHGRSQADGRAEGSSSSQNPPRKLFPQRNVTAFSIPGNFIPDGLHCLSL